MMKYKTLAAASVASIIWTSCAFAQCADCALYPDRDPLNGGVETPAAKMGLGASSGAGRASVGSNAYASMRGHYLRQSGAPQAGWQKVHMHRQK
jgi:hypothetical protein